MYTQVRVKVDTPPQLTLQEKGRKTMHGSPTPSSPSPSSSSFSLPFPCFSLAFSSFSCAPLLPCFFCSSLLLPLW